MNATLPEPTVAHEPALTDRNATLWHVSKRAMKDPHRTSAAGLFQQICLREIPQKIKSAFPGTSMCILAGEIPVNVFVAIPSQTVSESFHKFGPCVVEMVRTILDSEGIAWK